MSEIQEALSYIKVAEISYQEWLNVGMALKSAGYPLEIFEDWSRNDPRFKQGECEKKWASFQGEGIGIGTLYHLAIQRGYYTSKNSNNFEEIILPYSFPSCSFETKEEGHADIVKFVTSLYKPNDIVNIVSDTKFIKGKHIPRNQGDNVTVAELVGNLDRLETGIGGAWIRINPVDGNGVNNENVTDFNYCLLESDKMSLQEQYAMYKKLKLPLAFLVHSGGKSLHGVAKIYARSLEEYKQRVNRLYDYCENNGFQVDRANKNPSRLMRLPGIKRGEEWQYVVQEDSGALDYEAWLEIIENDEKRLLFEDVADFIDFPPPLKEELIKGILRKGHKMTITAASKAGKSYLLQNLAIAVATGGRWLGRSCSQGNVLYLDFEIDRNSLLNRISQVAEAMGVNAESLRDKMKICALRGKNYRIDELLSYLTESINKNWKPSLIVIDPIYRIMQGDENSAEIVSKFVNSTTNLAEKIGASIALVHHHSKGAQSNKFAQDRGSGSGVFARDADAIIDLVQIDPYREQKAARINEEKIRLSTIVMTRKNADSARAVLESYKGYDGDSLVRNALTFLKNPEEKQSFLDEIAKMEERVQKNPYFRVDGTLREFKNFEPFETQFNFPVHEIVAGMREAPILTGVGTERKLDFGRTKANVEKKEQFLDKVGMLYEMLQEAGDKGVLKDELLDTLKVTERSLKNYMKNLGAKSKLGRVYMGVKLPDNEKIEV